MTGAQGRVCALRWVPWIFRELSVPSIPRVCTQYARNTQYCRSRAYRHPHKSYFIPRHTLSTFDEFACRHSHTRFFAVRCRFQFLGNMHTCLPGLHTVADIYCAQCHVKVGWTYEEAFEESEKCESRSDMSRIVSPRSARLCSLIILSHVFDASHADPN